MTVFSALPGERGDVPVMDRKGLADHIAGTFEAQDRADDHCPAAELPSVVPLQRKTAGAPWWANRSELLRLLDHLENEGRILSAADAIQVVDSPWKWDREWEALGA